MNEIVLKNGLISKSSGVITGSLTLVAAAGETAFNANIDTFDLSGSMSVTGSVDLIGAVKVSGSLLVSDNSTSFPALPSDAAFFVSGAIGGGSKAVIGGDLVVSGGISGLGRLKAGYTNFSVDFEVSSSYYFMGIDSSSTVITASLLSASQYPAGQNLIFKDTGGAAGTNNILISPNGDTVDGALGGVLITVNSGSITLVSNGSNQFYIVADR